MVANKERAGSNWADQADPDSTNHIQTITQILTETADAFETPVAADNEFHYTGSASEVLLDCQHYARKWAHDSDDVSDVDTVEERCHREECSRTYDATISRLTEVHARFIELSDEMSSIEGAEKMLVAIAIDLGRQMIKEHRIFRLKKLTDDSLKQLQAQIDQVAKRTTDTCEEPGAIDSTDGIDNVTEETEAAGAQHGVPPTMEEIQEMMQPPSSPTEPVPSPEPPLQQKSSEMQNTEEPDSTASAFNIPVPPVAPVVSRRTPEHILAKVESLLWGLNRRYIDLPAAKVELERFPDCPIALAFRATISGHRLGHSNDAVCALWCAAIEKGLLNEIHLDQSFRASVLGGYYFRFGPTERVREYKRAISCFELATLSPSSAVRSQAHNALATMKLRGRGFATNAKGAASLYKLATVEGNAAAQFNLGRAYLHGQGIRKNRNKALRYIQLSADQGFGRSQTLLGEVFAEGRIVQRNYREAARYFRLAYNQGDTVAARELGFLHEQGLGVVNNAEGAIRLFQEAAENGCERSMHRLGTLFETGSGVDMDLEKAVNYYQLASGLGFAEAQYDLGLLYFHGQGVEQSRAKAIELISRASGQGHKRAKHFSSQEFERPTVSLVIQLR